MKREILKYGPGIQQINFDITIDFTLWSFKISLLGKTGFMYVEQPLITLHSGFIFTSNLEPFCLLSFLLEWYDRKRREIGTFGDPYQKGIRVDTTREGWAGGVLDSRESPFQSSKSWVRGRERERDGSISFNSFRSYTTPDPKNYL